MKNEANLQVYSNVTAMLMLFQQQQQQSITTGQVFDRYSSDRSNQNSLQNFQSYKNVAGKKRARERERGKLLKFNKH